MRVIITTFLLLLILSNACTYINRPDTIVNRWKVISVEFVKSGEKLEEPQITSSEGDAEDKYTIFYEFKKAGNYLRTNGLQKDSGQWLLSTDDKVLLLKSEVNKLDNAEFLIEELNSYQMVLSTEEKGKKELLKLIPAN